MPESQKYMLTMKTTDLCDAHADTPQAGLRVVAPMFRSYGGRTAFYGRIATLKLFEDNQLVRDAVAQDGHGKVLAVDGGGSLRSALVGDVLAGKAAQNGWAGIVVYGAIRDSEDIAQLPIGVFALGTNPLRSPKKGEGSVNVPVTFGGVTFTPGEMVYADPDGVVVSRDNLVTVSA
jgi:regulator of ribonuclease activity A